jgi:hypothetical protein
MTTSTLPFSLPERLSLKLGRVRDYWESLKRRENSMPFWDDLNLSSLPDLSDRLMLVDAFEKPQRYRLGSVGEQIREQYGADLTGKFVDEIDPKTPLEFFTAQASTTIESKAPTFFRFKPAISGEQSREYARLLLPMWGNGRIEMMLGVVVNRRV